MFDGYLTQHQSMCWLLSIKVNIKPRFLLMLQASQFCAFTNISHPMDHTAEATKNLLNEFKASNRQQSLLLINAGGVSTSILIHFNFEVFPFENIRYSFTTMEPRTASCWGSWPLKATWLKWQESIEYSGNGHPMRLSVVGACDSWSRCVTRTFFGIWLRQKSWGFLIKYWGGQYKLIGTPDRCTSSTCVLCKGLHN